MSDGNVLTSAAPPEMEAVVEEMESLYAAGKLLQAYRLGEGWGAPGEWSGTRAKIIAGRILNNLGAPRAGRMLHLKAFRDDRADPQAIYYGAYAVLERRGPLAGIEYWEKHTPAIPHASAVYPDWLAFRGTLAGMYRDFETADYYIGEAEKRGTEKAWIRVERARLFEGQDQYSQALESAKSSLESNPWFRPGVHEVAHLLQVMDRDTEALELLEAAVDHIESALICQQLAALQDHLQLHDRALQTLERIDGLCPIREKRFQQNISILRSNIAYHAGDYHAAAERAEASENPFMLAVAKKLRAQVEKPEKHPRVLLELPFVRQHYMTCAPATLAAIGRFFKKTTDHLSVVDAICYDGTASYSQRQWAQNNGWVAREFTVSWDSTAALIDRGVPFTLATIQMTSGHLQAVVGYDPMRGTLLCRDPYQYYLSEFHAQTLLEQQAAGGPRAMVLVPESHAILLENVDLPDAALYDLLHQVEQRLAAHDRSAAAAATVQLVELYPGHRLTFQAQRALASYDGDQAASLAAVDGLLQSYSKDGPLLFVKALILRSLERWDLLQPMLEIQCGNAGVDASFLQLYAEQIQHHTGDSKKAMDLLKRALRRQPQNAQSLIAMANQIWSQRKLEKATLLYQLAASVDSMNEGNNQAYFIASRHLKKTDAALLLLKKRNERLIARSSQPARTYFWALEILDRTVQAFEVLDDAEKRRPEDGGLLLYAADAWGRRADFVRARDCLKRAEGKSHRAQWLRESARLSGYEGDLLTALSIWNQVLAGEPLANDANREVARLIAQTQSRDAAAKHLNEVIERFPHNSELAQIRISWLRSRGHSAVAEAAGELVARQPANLWALVELSLSLAELGKTEESLRYADTGLQISPNATTAHFARANVLERMLRLEEARESYRCAIRVSVDYTFALNGLIDTYAAVDQRREALDFIFEELKRQVVFGDALLTYRQIAKGVMEQAELLAQLQQIKTARPDLWQAWSMVVYQQADLGQLPDALAVAREAVERFPLLPRVWYDQSYIHGLMGDRAGKIAALTQCMVLSPGWSFAARQLAETYRLEGEETQAMGVLERAIPRDPLDAANHHAYSNYLWNHKQKEQAIESAKKAVVLDPGLDDAWQSLQYWLTELGRPDDVVHFARESCRQRAGEAVSWLILARLLRGDKTLEERLTAVDAAIALSPLDSAAHDLKVRLLMEQKSFDAAIQACDPLPFGGNPPAELRGRRAWIHAQRNDIRTAMIEMKEVLESTPSYYWGWLQLVGWLSKSKSPEDYLVQTEAMVRRFPNDGVARNHLSSAQAQNKDTKAAKRTLLAAVNVAPDNAFALNRLFDAQIKDKELTAAGKTLDLIQRHMRSSEFLYRQVILAAKLQDSQTAEEGLARLCSREDFEIGAVNTAVESMDLAKMQDRVNAVLNQAASSPDIPPAVVGFWMRRATKSSQLKAGEKILKRFEMDTPQWMEAAVVYLSDLTQKKRYAKANRFIRAQVKRADLPTRLWGQMGNSLFVQNRMRQLIKVMGDWSKRSDAQPWMLINLSNAARRMNRFQLANEVEKFAMSLPADHTTLKHQVWLALDEVIAGTVGKQAKAVNNAETGKLDRFYPYVLSLFRALEPLCGKGSKVTAQQSRTARSAMAAAARKVTGWKTQPEVRYAMWRSAGRLTAVDPSLINRMWKAGWFFRAFLGIK